MYHSVNLIWGTTCSAWKDILLTTPALKLNYRIFPTRGEVRWRSATTWLEMDIHTLKKEMCLYAPMYMTACTCRLVIGSWIMLSWFATLCPFLACSPHLSFMLGILVCAQNQDWCFWIWLWHYFLHNFFRYWIHLHSLKARWQCVKFWRQPTLLLACLFCLDGLYIVGPFPMPLQDYYICPITCGSHEQILCNCWMADPFTNAIKCNIFDSYRSDVCIRFENVLAIWT